jgi:hypothetical protein
MLKIKMGNNIFRPSKSDYSRLATKSQYYLVINFTVRYNKDKDIHNEERVILGPPDEIVAEFNKLKENPYSFIKKRYIFSKESNINEIYSLNCAKLYTENSVRQF